MKKCLRIIFDTECDVVEIPADYGQPYNWDKEPRRYHISSYPDDGSWDQVTWISPDMTQLPTNAVEWMVYRWRSAASARLRAIELANGGGKINTEVTYEDAKPYENIAPIEELMGEPGLDDGTWEGVPQGGKNDVRKEPLIFIGNSVLRSVAPEDGYAFSGRRYDGLVPFETYSNIDDLEHELQAQCLAFDDFEPLRDPDGVPVRC